MDRRRGLRVGLLVCFLLLRFEPFGDGRCAFPGVILLDLLVRPRLDCRFTSSDFELGLDLDANLAP